MKTFLKVVGVLAGLVVVLAVVGFLLPGHYKVERTAVIAARPDTIFPLIGDLRAWSRWGVWFQRDPAMKVDYSASTTGVGAWSEWKSKSQGDGRMTITSVQAPGLFEYRIEFPDMGMSSTGTMMLAPGAAGATQVRMGMEGDLGRSPVNRWFGLFMGRMVGPDFDAGLANLKRISEAKSP
ncbi:MAG TPA: SRPBCC family protein [Opitutaceae bacterium]|nr:SRPBCC family protein [Opitutaceae bacterium]